jgi:hypothetical protein
LFCQLLFSPRRIELAEIQGHQIGPIHCQMSGEFELVHSYWFGDSTYVHVESLEHGPMLASPPVEVGLWFASPLSPISLLNQKLSSCCAKTEAGSKETSLLVLIF